MVRRLKADLRRLGEAFPERKVEPVRIAGLPADAPELDLWRRLAAYGELRSRRIATLPAAQGRAGQARLRRTAAAAALLDCGLRCAR